MTAPGDVVAAARPLVVAALAPLALGLPASARAQVAAEGSTTPVEPLRGTLERVVVHGASLEGNLSGDTPDRPVSVYLPPGYADEPGRRYPVLYFLHGYTDSDLYWMGWREHFVNVPVQMEDALEAGTARGMIVVMPNAFTRFHGSMYSSSVTTGDWETFVAEDLVAWVDAHYRTVPDRASRGLAGHSMGGYGAMRLAMKRPDVWSAVYVMSPCCMDPDLDPAARGAAADLEAVRDSADIRALPFGARAQLASAAAWAPDPVNPPLYLDLPVQDGENRPEVVSRLVANALLAMVPQYVYALRGLDALALDAGAQDRGIAASTRRMDALLTLYGVDHDFEIYDPGDHVSRVAERVEENVLPFFSRHLAFPGGGR